MHSANARPFSVSAASDEGRVARLNALVAAFIDKASGLSRLQAIYRSRPLRTAIRWLSAGGLLLVFPAGEVSHLHLRSRTITDPRWSPAVTRIAEKTRSLVLPAYIFGSNSMLFQLFGLIHPRLRTVMLPRELNNKTASPIHVRIGDAIPYQRLAAFPDVTAKTGYLRFCTYSLRDLDDPIPAKPARPKRKHPLAPAVAKGALRSDLDALPPHQCLSTSGALSVWYARSHQVPFVLQEIGRLRELTFRRVGEGTGRAADIDLFDSYYLHRFVWDSDNEKLVGAYRMGLPDDIIAKFGGRGLYTNTLFKLKRPVLARLNPAIELGRICAPGLSEALQRLTAAVEGDRPLRGIPSSLPLPVRPGKHQQRLPLDLPAVNGRVPANKPFRS